MLLTNKTAIIYGAAGHIGRAVARAFSNDGARVFLAGRTLAKVQQVADEIAATGGVANWGRGESGSSACAQTPFRKRGRGRARPIRRAGRSTRSSRPTWSGAPCSDGCPRCVRSPPRRCSRHPTEPAP